MGFAMFMHSILMCFRPNWPPRVFGLGGLARSLALVEKELKGLESKFIHVLGVNLMGHMSSSFC